MSKFQKILGIVFIFGVSFIVFGSKAEAATFSGESHSPTGFRPPASMCGGAPPVDFSAYPYAVSLNTTTGRITYGVHIGWQRCGNNLTETRAYAIYDDPNVGNVNVCPFSGIYGSTYDTFDCVKYIGSPPYSEPGNSLQCWATPPENVNHYCTSPENFPGIERHENNPSVGGDQTWKAMSYDIPGWGSLQASDGSYTINSRLCQFYKNGASFDNIVSGDRCQDISITVNWVAPVPDVPPTLTCTTTAMEIQRGVPFTITPTATTSAATPSSGHADLSYTMSVDMPGSLSDETFTGSIAWSSGSTSHSVTVPSFDSSGTVSYTVTADGATGSPVTCTIQLNLRDRPYFKFYGGDVHAGGGFNFGSPGGCSPGTIPSNYGAVRANSEDTGSGYRGSSSQFTISALMQVNSVYSGSQRLSRPLQPKGLTFANTSVDADAATPGNQPSAAANSTFGGGSGSGKCIKNYFDSTRYPSIIDISAGAQPLTSLPADLDGGVQQYLHTGNLTISNLGIPTGRQVALYVDGDVYISGNINFGTGAGTRADMPNFYLIVKGNIFIRNTVNRIDGTYIAQPNAANDTSRGTIYTCANSMGSPVPTASLRADCNSQLAVNGSLVAQNIRFLRALGNIGSSSTSELPNFDTGLGGTSAAEVINYTPEVYIAPSPLNSPAGTPGSSSSSVGSYDYIRSLPPTY